MAARKKMYLTSTEKMSILESINKLITKMEKKRDSISDSYERSYLKDTIKAVKDAKRSFSNIW